LLQFNVDGLLDPGDYPMTLNDLRQSLLVIGPGDGTPWKSAWRSQLVSNLEILVEQLYKVRIDEIFIDGSFVEDKANPSDIDGYFVTDPITLIQTVRKLNTLDPHKVWTWDPNSRTFDRNSAKMQLPMWHRYRVELYPHYDQDCGILDEYGHQQKFPAAFRKTRDTFLPKGIIKIIK
jgi:hypothetical protein